ncbi:3-oxoacyl-[acyl-carrier-protein] synthase-1 [Luteibacter sp. Sphag1AF]|uniref:beta-ketoacyl-[acyl-carrier-protein] synthase family protein n=1 Tax=Luteibacter sp. Sphag1AF TaxID=2587031 RepID=UPI00160F1AB7|nr:beta-ketoacyl-[acyl-carrier-protein] synthase family protein [Luteibacter sp. Sphag1AF]MBB3227262.1 3-oxoacyl-[acyl-carrier-protein] synthase-1 [Luteibacter sp. Sphag1AF]
MKRVVVTGMGAVSCLGTGADALLDGLFAGRSGIVHVPAFTELGMRCQVGAPVDAGLLDEAPRKLRRYLSTPATYAWHAMREAIAQSGLEDTSLAGRDCGLLMGGNAALSEHEAALHAHRTRGISRMSPFTVPRCMTSALPASLAHAFGIGGRSYLLSSACASGAHAIGQAMELIQLGRQNIVICGGAEELDEKTAMCFDVMGALSASGVSRPYDEQRDGFVPGAGAAVLVLESLEHATARGATVLAELVGYGAANDAQSMVQPGVDGIAEAMRQALEQSGATPDYINTHACSTPQGDLMEWQAIHAVFAELGHTVPGISSIKGGIGHAPGAAGALDAVACIGMMQRQSVPGMAIAQREAAFASTPLLTGTTAATLRTVLSNSFGFGGSCATLVFRREAA